jgi:toxin ParE1/3/4
MARFRLRKVAREDLLGIGEYTAARWSDAQSERYVSDLYACFQRLADNAMLGRVYAPIPVYSRFEHASHVVFFRREKNGSVVIVRVLHERMIPERQLGEGDEDET